MSIIKIGRYNVELTNEDKIIFPKSKITKGEFIDYYRRIAPIMLPYIKDRPLTMRRFVEGISKEGFYQKDASDYFPSWIKRKSIRKKEDGMVKYVVANNAATLVYLANQYTIVMHIWLSKIDKLRYPDRMIFDLDPAGKATFALVRWTAKELKKLLEKKLGLKTFIMTTGSKGVHLVVPLKRMHTFDYVRAFAHDAAEYVVHQYPKKLTLEMRKAKRGNRIFVDYLRNAFAQTGVAPYSVRAKPGATVATPIKWVELDTVTPTKYTIKNIFARLARTGDPWKKIGGSAVSLKQARKKLDALCEQAGLVE